MQRLGRYELLGRLGRGSTAEVLAAQMTGPGGFVRRVAIKRMHPELAGGLGVYSSRRFSTPYCHIDARGERKRWRG